MDSQPAKRLLTTAEEANINTFSVQSFAELSSVTWERSSALTKLLTIAVVCNKAKFVYGEEPPSKMVWQLVTCKLSDFVCMRQQLAVICCIEMQQPCIAYPARH